MHNCTNAPAPPLNDAHRVGRFNLPAHSPKATPPQPLSSHQRGNTCRVNLSGRAQQCVPTDRMGERVAQIQRGRTNDAQAAQACNDRPTQHLRSRLLRSDRRLPVERLQRHRVCWQYRRGEVHRLQMGRRTSFVFGRPKDGSGQIVDLVGRLFARNCHRRRRQRDCRYFWIEKPIR